MSERIDLAERRNWAERCIEMGRLRDAMTIGPVEMLAILDRLRKAEARIEKVREMHRPIDIEPSDTICGECSLQLPNGHFFGKVVEWPCETVKALTEGDEQ